MVPFLDLKTQYAAIREEVEAAVARVLESQRFILGPEVEGLEKELGAYCGCDHAVGVTSGTDALLVALMAIGIEPGDEVITSSYSFFASAGSIWRLGARPVFVDIDPGNYNLDPDLIEGAITEKTRAIMPVHLYGQTADMDPIMTLAQKHDLFVVEDAAQATGAGYRSRQAGSIGHLGCFSFFPSKNLGAAGDAGMVTTSDPELADRVRLLHNHGFRPKYHNKVVGGNFRLDELQAAILRVKLKYLAGWTEKRRTNASIYRELFHSSTASEPSVNSQRAIVSVPAESDDCYHIYNQFVIRIQAQPQAEESWNGARSVSAGRSDHLQRSTVRDRLIKHLKQNDIGCEVYYPVPLPLQECFDALGHEEGDFPAAERAAAETLALPVYPELTRSQVEQVVETVEEFIRSDVQSQRSTG